MVICPFKVVIVSVLINLIDFKNIPNRDLLKHTELLLYVKKAEHNDLKIYSLTDLEVIQEHSYPTMYYMSCWLVSRCLYNAWGKQLQSVQEQETLFVNHSVSMKSILENANANLLFIF